MKMEKSTYLLGLACYHAIMKKADRLSLEEIAAFGSEFGIIKNETIIISREDALKLCEKNSRYIFYDEDSNELVFKSMTKDDAYHFYWNYGMYAIYYYTDSVVGDAEKALRKVLESEISLS